MKTSYKWIRDLVPGLDLDIETYCDGMTMSGTKVEFFTPMGKDLENIVIGEIKEIKKHPDADKLLICQVDIGGKVIQIVTGVANVFEGAKIPVVLPGGRVAGTHKDGQKEGGTVIEAGKLRGVESFGMMCSPGELGCDINLYPDAASDGIYILKPDAVVGESAIEYLGLDDTIIEYEVTSNRVDCYSVLGIAREAAATFNLKYEPPKVIDTGNTDDVDDYIKVSIVNENLCKRFTARVIKNLKIEESPDWIKKRLAAHGIRPINNIVDITNYVMVEYGQPMHAYDLNTIQGGEIIVDNAKSGEEFITLDGQTRQLSQDMLMIKDRSRSIGVAGIMGGENTMITDSAETLVLEVACFNGANIRQSAKALGMRTEASSIFEKGLDPENTILAMNRACALIEELGAGTVVKGVVDVYPKPIKQVQLPFEPERYNALLGTDISAQKQLEILERVGITCDSDNILSIPSFRQDILCFADIAEEVARFYGYDKIPTTLPQSGNSIGGRDGNDIMGILAENTLRAYGYSEGYSYSFESPKVFDKLLFPENAAEREAIKIVNPLGEDFSIMRTTPVAGMLSMLATNSARNNENVKLYERGHIYIPVSMPLKELPKEESVITFGFYGDGDFYDLKAAFEDVLMSINLKGTVKYLVNEDNPFLHPGRKAAAKYDNKDIGYLGQVHPLVCENFGIRGEAYIGVINLSIISDIELSETKYKPIGNFPKAVIDLSMLVPNSVNAGRIEDIIIENGGEYLESIKLFDIYKGKQVKEGYKSMAYSLIFRARDKSLSEAEINNARARVLEALKGEGIDLRS